MATLVVERYLLRQVARARPGLRGLLDPTAAMTAMTAMTTSSSPASWGRSHASCSASFLGSWSQGKEREFDVVIVGGGMIGSALACALKIGPLTSELKVAVVDRGGGEAKAVDEDSSSRGGIPDLRVSTLTPSTLRFLDKVGVGEKILPPVSAAFDTMQVWDAYGRGHMQFSSPEGLGQVVENEVLKDALQERAATLGCEYVYGKVGDILLPQPDVGITKPKAPEGGARGGDQFTRVVLDCGTALRSPLVVGADGVHSLVAERAKIRSTRYNYGQRAVTCTVRTSEPHATAFQRFLPTGPIALLPVRDGFSNIVWTTTVAEALRLENLGPEELAEEANEAFHGAPRGGFAGGSGLNGGGLSASLSSILTRASAAGLLPGLESSDSDFARPPEILEVVGVKQKSFPLGMKHAMTYCQRGAVLVGDAAHRIHPLAGQGVNIGFGDVEALMAILQEALWSGQNYSDLLTLEKYSRERRGANAGMIRTLDAVKALYQTQFAPVALARNLGMDLLNAFGPLKTAIVGYASSNAKTFSSRD